MYFVSYTTVGRPKRRRARGAGRAVKVAGHTRTPRGRNSGKRAVRVDGYARGKAAKRTRRKKR